MLTGCGKALMTVPATIMGKIGLTIVDSNETQYLGVKKMLKSAFWSKSYNSQC